MMTVYFGEAASSYHLQAERWCYRRTTCRTSWHFLNEVFGKNVCVVAWYGWRHSEDSSVMSHLPTVQASTYSKLLSNHAWKWPSHPWSRLHLDYAGPFLGHTFLVVVDAHSKWLEVFQMPAATSRATIQQLRTSLICPVWPTTDDCNR